MIVITGWRSHIAEEFRTLLPADETPVWGKPVEEDVPLDADRYLFCQGLLRPKATADQSALETSEGWRVNYESIVDACQQILAANGAARICIIGSESGYRGSFDGTYAAAKRALHHFIETTALRSPAQQIVGISPWIVADTGMTERRADQAALKVRGKAHPKQRFLTAREVAVMAHFLLYGETDYVSGTVIRMHGSLQ